MTNSSLAHLDENSVTGSDSLSWPVLAAALGLFALALVTRVALLGEPPHFDELYHILAARGWLETGEFQIADGKYERAWLYTLLVAGVFQLFGDGLEVARIPSVLFGAALVPAIFLWTRSVAGVTAASVAAFLAVFWPVGIDLSQLVRFYPPQALLFWLAAIAIYRLAERPIGRVEGVLLGIGATAALLLATHLQVVTLIGLLSLGCWAALFVLLPMVWRLRNRWAVLGGALVIGLLLMVLLFETGLVAEAWAKFRFVPLWLEGQQDNLRYYFFYLTSLYPLLIPLLPIGAILAIAHRPRPALFCSIIFFLGITIHSFAAMKDPRYIYYLTPFFFVLTGLAVEAVLVPLFRRLACETDTALSAILPRARFGRNSVAVHAVLAAAVLFAIAGLPAVQQAASYALGKSGKGSTDWNAARATLTPYLVEGSLVLTGNELNMLDVLGRYDVLVDASRLTEIPGGGEFAIDPRTGHPVVAEPASVVALVRCSPRGVFVDDVRGFEGANGVSPFHTALLAGELKGLSRVDLPRRSGLIAYAWEHAPAAGSECSRISERGLSMGAETFRDLPMVAPRG